MCVGLMPPRVSQLTHNYTGWLRKQGMVSRLAIHMAAAAAGQAQPQSPDQQQKGAKY
jgi:hypothetical protein